MTALAVQLAALTAAVMAGQRASAAEVRTPSPRPSPPWTAATLPAAPAAPPAPPAPAPPPPPTPAAPPPTTPAAQPTPTPTPTAAEPLYELSAPDFCAAMGHEHRFPAIKSLTATITKALKVNLDPITMDTEMEALLNLLRTHDTNMPFYLDISPEVRTTLLAEGGALAEWLQATDLAVANGVHTSLDKDSDNVKNFYSKYSDDRALCSSGRALLAHFKDMFNVITGLALLQAERTMRDLVPSPRAWRLRRPSRTDTRCSPSSNAFLPRGVSMASSCFRSSSGFCSTSSPTRSRTRWSSSGRPCRTSPRA